MRRKMEVDVRLISTPCAAATPRKAKAETPMVAASCAANNRRPIPRNSDVKVTIRISNRVGKMLTAVISSRRNFPSAVSCAAKRSRNRMGKEARMRKSRRLGNSMSHSKKVAKPITANEYANEKSQRMWSAAPGSGPDLRRNSEKPATMTYATTKPLVARNPSTWKMLVWKPAPGAASSLSKKRS